MSESKKQLETEEQLQLQRSSDISLKLALLTAIDYLKELFRKWYIIAIFLGLGVFAATYYLGQQDTTYNAKVTFMTNNDKGGGVSGVLQLAGQLGLSSGGEVKSEKIVDLLSSEFMVFSTLEKVVTVNGKEDLLFNHYIDFFNLNDEWSKDERLQNFRFENGKPKTEFSLVENIAAKKIYGKILTKHLAAGATKYGIITARCNSTSEHFSKVFAEELVNTLRDFYEEKAVEKQRETFAIIRNRCDSIYSELLKAEYALADWYDSNKKNLKTGTLNAQTRMKGERIESNAEILNVMYAEAVKNREIANMNLLSSTPMIQIIDYPSFPLSSKTPDKKVIYLVFLILSMGIGVVLISFYKLIRDTLQE